MILLQFRGIYHRCHTHFICCSQIFNSFKQYLCDQHDGWLAWVSELGCVVQCHQISAGCLTQVIIETLSTTLPCHEPVSDQNIVSYITHTHTLHSGDDHTMYKVSIYKYFHDERINELHRKGSCFINCKCLRSESAFNMKLNIILINTICM